DERVDAAGYQRSADRLRIHGGTEFDLGEKLNGEFSLGWVREALDDDRLPAISGLSVDADIRWSPERGTTIGLRGTTTVEGTTTAGESGSILYSGRLTAERSIRSNLTANAALGVDWRDYAGSNGHDRILSAEAGLTWWLNRYAGLTTPLRSETQTSNLPGRDYDAASRVPGRKLHRSGDTHPVPGGRGHCGWGSTDGAAPVRSHLIKQFANDAGHIVVDVPAPKRKGDIRLDETFRRAAVEGSTLIVVAIESLVFLQLQHGI